MRQKFSIRRLKRTWRRSKREIINALALNRLRAAKSKFRNQGDTKSRWADRKYRSNKKVGVKTGQLRRSAKILTRNAGKSFSIGFTAPHAKYFDQGTRHSVARSLLPTSHTDDIRDMRTIRRIIKKNLK